MTRFRFCRPFPLSVGIFPAHTHVNCPSFEDDRCSILIGLPVNLRQYLEVNSTSQYTIFLCRDFFNTTYAYPCVFNGTLGRNNHHDKNAVVYELDSASDKDKLQCISHEMSQC